MKTCDNCRWRRDLVKLEYMDGRYVKTYQEGFACLGLSCDDEQIWICGMSGMSFCEMFTPKEG